MYKRQLIDSWKRGSGGIGKRLDNERRTVVKLAETPTARNLIRVYFLQERLKSQGTREHGIARVHVVGAGVMGGDIAAWAAHKGFEVTLQDREQPVIDAAIGRARTLFEKKAKTPERIVAASARLLPDIDGTGVAQADLVIEAIIEDLHAKQALYAAVEPKLPAAAPVSYTDLTLPTICSV